MSVQAAEGNVRCAYKIHGYSDTGNAADGDAATQLNVETRQQLQKEHQRTKVMAHLKQVAWDSEMKNALQWTEIYDEQQQHQKWKKTVWCQDEDEAEKHLTETCKALCGTHFCDEVSTWISLICCSTWMTAI